MRYGFISLLPTLVLIISFKLPKVVTNSDLPSTAVAGTESEDGPVWLPRTKVTLQPFTESTRSFTIRLNHQSAHIKSILRAASRHGAVMLVTNHEFCGLETSGLHALTLASLIHCSDAKGYDGELDISHRLEHGDHARYILPLVKYVCVSIFAVLILIQLFVGCSAHHP